MIRNATALLLLAGLAAGQAGAQTVEAPETRPLFETRDWVVIGGLFATHLALFSLDDDVRDLAVDMRSAGSDRAADMLRPLGRTRELAVFGAATYLVGIAVSDERVADFGLHAFASLAISNFVSGALKVVGGRARPVTLQADGTAIRRDPHEWELLGGWGDEGARRSYPSGHSSNAFTLAAVFAEELGGPAPWIAYPLAAGVAWSRVNDEVHWASDVVMGAFVGVLTGQLVVRYGHRRDGWLERTLLVRPSGYDDRLDVGLQIPLSR
jgi:membrane-associated phospholipid phosphatase